MNKQEEFNRQINLNLSFVYINISMRFVCCIDTASEEISISTRTNHHHWLSGTVINHDIYSTHLSNERKP